MWVHVQGKMTTTFLGITVLSDIYVLICMSITMSLTKASKNPFFFSLQYLESVFSMVYRVHVAYMYTRARARTHTKHTHKTHTQKQKTKK